MASDLHIRIPLILDKFLKKNQWKGIRKYIHKIKIDEPFSNVSIPYKTDYAIQR